MNLNNKFGECCKCPALMEDGRYLSSYIPHKTYNEILMFNLGVKDTHQYRNVLQKNGELLINNIQKETQTNYVCLNHENKLFYERIDDINGVFDREYNKVLSSKTDINTFYN